MSSLKQRRWKVRARSGAQAELALAHAEIVCTVAAETHPAARGRALMFEDPDPRGLWAGRSPLADHLKEAGLGWALAMRTFMRQQDWTAFEAAYKAGGRPPYHPAAMMSLVVLGVMVGQSSLRSIETLARADLRAWWLTGGIGPDHSMIGRFLNRHADLITTKFFEDLTKAVLRVVGSQDRTMAADATVIQAVSSRLRTIQQEAARQAAAQAGAALQAKPDDAKLQKQRELADEVVKACETRSAQRRVKGRKNTDAPVSPLEPEAVVQPMKNGQVAPSYQACIGVNGDRIIVAQHVEGSSEPAAVPHLVDQAARVLGDGIARLLADSRYNTGEIHNLAEERGFELLSPEGATSGGDARKKSKHFDKSRFTYHAATDTYTCPASHLLVRHHKTNDRGRPLVSYVAVGCDGCPLRAQCTSGKGNRAISRYEHEAAKERLREKMQDPQVLAIYKRRQVTVEPVFAETKGIQGFTRFRRRRMRGVRLEHSLQCAAHNLRRAIRIKLPWTRHGASGAATASRQRAASRRALRRHDLCRQSLAGRGHQFHAVVRRLTAAPVLTRLPSGCPMPSRQTSH